MGYTTQFEGELTIEPPLNRSEGEFISAFQETRRMAREKGPLFVGGTGFWGQGHDPDIYDYNKSPRDQPGLWCEWTVSERGDKLYWNGAEKFYRAEEWLIYIIDNLLAPSSEHYVKGHLDEDKRLHDFTHDHVLNGRIIARGEEETDVWGLLVENNNVIMVTP